MRPAVIFSFLLFLPVYSASRYQNVALRGKATQSQRYKPEGTGFGGAYSAIDGNRDATYWHGSCSHTAQHDNPWWGVDLLQSYTIQELVIVNRGDCCGERLSGAQIRIGDISTHGFQNPLADTISYSATGRSESILLSNPMKGRYVTIVIPGEQKILSLCEVEVYGYPSPNDENVALQGRASQSSQYEMGSADKANDGNRNNNWLQASCSRTTLEPNPWWRLDLLRPHKVFSIKVFNRDDEQQRLDGAEIRVGNSLANNGNDNPSCGDISSGSNFHEIQCNGMEGRYVNIVLTGKTQFLTLCEVEVHGSRLE